jgi:hypothetical protein
MEKYSRISGEGFDAPARALGGGGRAISGLGAAFEQYENRKKASDLSAGLTGITQMETELQDTLIQQENMTSINTTNAYEQQEAMIDNQYNQYINRYPENVRKDLFERTISRRERFKLAALEQDYQRRGEFLTQNVQKVLDEQSVVLGKGPPTDEQVALVTDTINQVIDTTGPVWNDTQRTRAKQQALNTILGIEYTKRQRLKLNTG